MIALVLMSALVLTMTPPSGARAASPVGVLTATQLNDAFKAYGDTSGEWSGGDGTASVPLPDGRVAWLFSDTYIGTVNADGSRPANTPMINNSIVVQTGAGLQDTIFGGTRTAPVAVMPPTSDGNFYWVGDGTASGGKLRVFYNRYARSGQGALDMALQGTSLATFDASTFALESSVPVPVADKIAWGVELVEDGPYTYVYGSEYIEDTTMRYAHVARTSSDLSTPWEYWNGSSWVADELASARILSGVGTTFGVQKVGTGWVLTTQQTHGIFRSDFVAYPSAGPVGPFSEPFTIYKAPEPAQGNEQIVYDVHVHPELTTADKLLWSYNVNTLTESGNTADARIYRPRFVETQWPPAVPDPSTVPAKVTGLTVTQTTAGEAQLQWTAVPGATNYWVYQRNVTDGQTTFAREPDPVTDTVAGISFVRHAKTYQFVVTAANDVGEGPRSDQAVITMNVVPPAAPTGVTAVPDGTTGGVRVTWQGVTGAWNYQIFYRNLAHPEEEFTAATTVGPDLRTFQVKGLNVDDEHEFYVIARGAGGDSDRSDLVRATPVGIPPAAPTNLTATATATGSVALSWTASATPNVWYWVYQRDVTALETDFVRLPLPISSGTSMEAGYLADGHTYEFAVTAYTNGGESAKTATASAISAYPDLPVPTGLVATAGNGEVALRWNSLGADIWYWVYQRDVTAGETGFTKLPLPISSGSSMTSGYLTNGHVYEFRVGGIGPHGDGPLSAPVLATPKYPAPGPVAGLAAAAETDGDIRVSWTDVPDTYFWIYQRDVTAGEAFRKLQYPTQGSSFTAGGLLQGHVYEFKVQPNRYGQDGPVSAVVTATSTYAKPPAPTGLTARAMGNATIRLDWNGPAAVTFWIYQRDVTAGETTFTKLAYPSLDKTAELGLMKSGHKYEFKVVSENQGGTSAFSNVASATSYGGLPGAPSNLTAGAQNGQVKLSWTASSTAGVQYIVYQRNLTAGDPWDRLPLPITGTSMTAGYLQNGQTYAFRVTAQNGIGESGGSNTAQARPMPPLPVAPTSLTATAQNNAVQLSWPASSTPDVYYWVEMRPAGGVWDRLPLPISVTSLRVAPLRNAVTYEFRVRANNLSGDSAPSPVDTARPMPPAPVAPATLTATAGDRRVTIDWSASTVAGVYYWVEYRVAGKGWSRLPYPVVGQTWLTVVPLANNTPYEFRVRSANEWGPSAPSPVATATPVPPLPSAPYFTGKSEYGGGISVTWADPNTVDRTYYGVSVRNLLTGETRTSNLLKDAVTGEYAPEVEQYEIRVRSRNSRGWGPWSTPIRAIPDPLWSGIDTTTPGNGAANKAAKLLARGKVCKYSARQIICFNTDWSAGQTRPLTMGDYLGYPGNEDDFNFQLKCEAVKIAGLAELKGTAVAQQYGPRLPLHEARHSQQWAKYGIGFGALYLAAELAARKAHTHNPFESDANLYWGGYISYPGLPSGCL